MRLLFLLLFSCAVLGNQRVIELKNKKTGYIFKVKQISKIAFGGLLSGSSVFLFLQDLLQHNLFYNNFFYSSRGLLVGSVLMDDGIRKFRKLNTMTPVKSEVNLDSYTKKQLDSKLALVKKNLIIFMYTLFGVNFFIDGVNRLRECYKWATFEFIGGCIGVSLYFCLAHYLLSKGIKKFKKQLKKEKQSTKTIVKIVVG